MDNCEEQRILDMINKNKKCCRPCFGPTGPTGATARCNKSSIYIFKW